jgi:hypothetical protein
MITLDGLAERRWTMLEGLVASGERAPGTLEADRILYRKHVAPWAGRMKVQKLAATHVSELIAKKRRGATRRAPSPASMPSYARY